MRILRAIDDSKFAEVATETVIAQARPKETEVHVLNVIDVLPQLMPEMGKYTPDATRAGRATQARGSVSCENR